MHPDLRSGRAPARLSGTALAAVLAVLALVVAACGGGAAGGITTSGAWARTSPMVAGAGAAYVVIANEGSAADALVGAKSDVAATVEVHETYEVEAPMGSDEPMESMAGGGMASPMASTGMGSSPMLGMRRVERIEVPAGGTLELKPGGYHIMLIDLQRELKVGDTVEIILVFEQAGEIPITAEVREG